jgi:protein TonB
VAATPKNAAPLQVLAEPLGNGLINVRWNAQSPLIAQARDGRLVVTEHDKAARIMALDATQLQIGHLTYQSTAESIQFDLEVNDRSGAVAKESVLALSSPAGAAPTAAVKQQIVPQAPPPKAQAVVQLTPLPAEPIAAPVTPVRARAFVPPPVQQRTEQRAVIDAPPVLASAAPTPVGVNLPASLGAVSPPPAAPPKQVRVESTLQAANLIKKVVPVYPVLARAAGIQGNVRFTALIGKDGRIQDVKVLSGPRPLVEAASEAVKQWVYRPTLLNGQPLEVITEISVNFTINSTAR